MGEVVQNLADPLYSSPVGKFQIAWELKNRLSGQSLLAGDGDRPSPTRRQLAFLVEVEGGHPASDFWLAAFADEGMVETGIQLTITSRFIVHSFECQVKSASASDMLEIHDE